MRPGILLRATVAAYAVLALAAAAGLFALSLLSKESTVLLPLVALCLAGLAAACVPDRPRDVVVITLDTLRAIPCLRVVHIDRIVRFSRFDRGFDRSLDIAGDIADHPKLRLSVGIEGS